ncbi:acyl-CoA dehydrogenase family protein [Natronomonas salsuginis]|jgi:alkylation response protein AidB-like acyl-CoA dehydrogenase|uniref:Acyl-CoA dehydrogenase n=1 Tax=Natronomonas salsuginis TaxID=2217661 RepID=A0A4U5JJA9_9EURY|nr:acyl-CoA dehydrogenase family protein [Natronomonas salsuginis]TKR26179.1 acyl-CoA dehydrogenase [Natronomonas salsuginis]
MTVPVSQEYEAVRKTAREYAQNELKPIYREYNEKGEFPYDLVEDMAEVGLRGIMVPVEYGGVGMDMLSHAIVMEEVSAVWPSAGIKMDEGLMRYLRMFGTEEQKERYLPKLCSGEYVDAIALSEPDYGSDFAGIETTAERDGDEYVLNGSKMWVTNAGKSDLMVVTAKTDQPERHRGISLFLIETQNNDGCTVEPGIDMMGFDASESHEVVLDDCRVPEENLLGEENGGFYHTMKMLEENRVSVAARGLGIAVGAYDASKQYITEREQFGKKIGEFQAIQHKIADMAVQIENSKHLVYNAARLCDDGEPFDTEASMAKLYASEAAHDVASEAVQIHGGYGYTKEFPVQMFFRDAKGIEIYEGTSEIQKNVIAKNVME